MSKSRTDWRHLGQMVRPRSVRQWVLGPLILLLAAAWFAPVAWLGVTGVVAADSNARWDGGPLTLSAYRATGAECTVRPDDGPSRRIQVDDSGAGIDPLTDTTTVDAWFSGPASVTCDEAVDVSTGWSAHAVAAKASVGWWLAVAVGLGVLVVVYVVSAPPAVPTRGRRARAV
jgi:hypothetical protein